jgi:hypothetical protein
MMVYYEQRPPDEERPAGCLDALLVIRAMFSILFWPLVAILLVGLDAVAIFALFATHPALALIPIAITGVAVWLFARWEQNRYRPPDL